MDFGEPRNSVNLNFIFELPGSSAQFYHCEKFSIAYQWEQRSDSNFFDGVMNQKVRIFCMKVNLKYMFSDMDDEIINLLCTCRRGKNFKIGKDL